MEEGQTILGIDPGLNVTGYGVIEVARPAPRLREAGVLRIKPRQSLSVRLKQLHDGLVDVLSSFQPSCMAIEELYSHYERPRTAILMGHARGVICLAAAQRGILVRHYGATQVKKTLTGNGRAPKAQVQLAIARQFGLSEPPDPPDVADALAIALCDFFLEDAPLSGRV